MSITLSKMERREWVTIENEGQQIFGVLHRPMGVENPPIILIMHGFASSKHGSNRCYVTLAENFAKAGIATFRFDFRGSGDSEGSLSDLTFEDLVSDAIAASEYALNLEGIDSERFGIFGASLGGAIGVLSAALHKKAKAMALWAPVASGELWYRDFLQKNPALAEEKPSDILGEYQGVTLNSLFKEQFGRMFAYKTLATLSDLPILHMHGENDTIISLAHQEAYQKACQNSDSRFIVYPETQHRLGFAPIFPEIIQESIGWFNHHL